MSTPEIWSIAGVMVIVVGATLTAAVLRVRRRLEDAQRLLREVTDNAPGFFFQLVIDPSGKRRYNFISRGIEKISGYSADEVMENTNLIFSITDPDHQAAIREAWAESRRTLTPYRIEYRIRTKSGGVKWLRGSGQPSLLSDGSILWNGFTIDVSAEKEAEELHRTMELRVVDAEQRMRDVVENLPGVVYQLRVEPDLRFSYEYVSARNIDVWGITREESLRDPVAPHRLVVPEDRERVREEWREAMRTGKPLSSEFQIIRPDGERRWLRSNATPRRMEDGHVVLNGHTLDITVEKEAETRVALAEQRLREFTEHLPGLVWQLEVVWGKPLKYNYLTDHTMQIYGLPRDEVLRNPDRVNSMFDPRDMPRIFKNFQESLKTMTPTQADFRVKRADNGETRWLRTYSVPRRTGDGVQTSGFTWDITAEKEAEEKAAAAERLVREITDSVPGIVYQMRRSPKGDIKMAFISRAVERYSGVSQQKAHDDFGAVMAAMFPEDRLAVAKAIQQSSQTGEPAPVGWRVRAPDGSVRYLHASAALRKEEDGTVIWNGFAADITQLKETEAALASAKEAAEAANRAKSDFLANMSHEIRTPMNAIIGLSQLALQAHLPEREHDYLDKIHRAARSLLGIINDILDFSKIEAGKLALEHTPFRLADVLENVSSLIGMKAAEKDLDYACTIGEGAPRALIGDPLRLGQVLINLAGNAVKFTERGKVSISVEPQSAAADRVVLHFIVRDTGIGISSDKVAHLFESFYQADASTTRRYGGTGLGLSISRRLVEAMNGRVWVESRLAEGSTFHFTAEFGVASREQIDALPTAERVHRLDGVRVLVVEDNETNQIIAREILDAAGARVTLADNGREAVDALEQAQYDVILMDVHMPVMDGHTATRLIRRKLPDLPIIAMTASATLQDRERCTEAGMNDHVSKPIDVNELFTTLRRHLRTISPLPLAGEGGAPAPGEGSSLPGIDVPTGVRRLGGRRAAFDHVLGVFRNSVGDPVRDIEAALAASDRARATDLAHRLRGAAGNVAALRLAAIAEEIEKTLKDGGNAQPLLATLQERWSEVDAGLTRFFATRDGAAPVVRLDPSQIDRQLAELDTLLSRDDADAVTLLRNLRSALAQGSTTMRFAELEKRVSTYDFSAARQSLRALRSDLGMGNRP
ncbi:MAG TPA: PAS domain-containing protein [Nevskiaceae bacterium]|nr:PAS domain-containing protein [Nevskiaceae bacterium]